MRIKFLAKSDLELAGIPDIPCEIEVPIEPVTPWLERAISDVELLPDLPVPEPPVIQGPHDVSGATGQSVGSAELDRVVIDEVVSQKLATKVGDKVLTKPEKVRDVIEVSKRVNQANYTDAVNIAEVLDGNLPVS